MKLGLFSQKNRNLSLLRKLGILEGISYLSLFGITMPLKYVYGLMLPNFIVGLAHGILFISYCLFTFIIFNQFNISKSKVILLIIASLLPFGTFITDRKILAPIELKK